MNAISLTSSPPQNLTRISRYLSSCLLLGIVATSGESSDDLTAPTDETLSAALGYRYESANASEQIIIPTGVSLEDGLDEGEAIALALSNNASFQVVLSNLGLEQAALVEAGQWSNPVFSLIFPYGPRQWEMAASLPLQELWLKPRRNATAEMRAEATSHKVVAAGLDLVRDVRTALLTHQRNIELAKNAAQRVIAYEESAQAYSQRHSLKLANYRSVFAAEQALLESRISRKSYQNDVEESRMHLRGLMGLSEYTRELKFDPLERSLPDSFDASLSKQTALSARPDYRAAELELEAAAKERGIARSDFYRIVGQLDVDFPNGNGKVAPGLDFELPIFNRGNGGKAKTTADWKNKAARFADTRSRIFIEIDEALNRYTHSLQKRQGIEEKLIPSLEMESERLQAAAEEGLTNSTVSIQAGLNLLDGERQLELARFEQLSALVSLERAMGTRTPHAH